MTEDEIECRVCCGTGEGQRDGAACPACAGRGYEIDAATQQAIDEQIAERQWEIERYGNQ